MIRSELVQALLKDNPSLSQRDVEAIVSTFFDEITQRLAANGRVELRGFGAFPTRARDARGNLTTSAVVPVKSAASRVRPAERKPAPERSAVTPPAPRSSTSTSRTGAVSRLAGGVSTQ